jgi:hypothetical protein
MEATIDMNFGGVQGNFVSEYTKERIESIVNDRYQWYLENLKPLSFMYNNKRIGWKVGPLVDNKDYSYFHLITVDASNTKTYCCPNKIIRCEQEKFTYNPLMSDKKLSKFPRTICGHRIQCIPDIIKVFNKKDNLIWEELCSTHEGKITRICILDQEHKYYVVLQINSNQTIYFLTAYPVQREKISDLKKVYKKRKDDTKTHLLSLIK